MHVLTLRAQPHPRGYTVELISLRNGSPRANLNACSGCLPREVVYHACTKQSSTWRVAALFLNKVIALNGTYTEYKTIFMEKKVVRSLYTMEPACLVCRSSEYLTQGCGGLSLSHRWSLIRPHPVRRGKGRKCIVSPFDGAEAARPDLRYTPFSLTKLRRGRAYATCSQIPPAAAHLVTSRRPPGIPSGLAPLPVFPRRCMWIFHSSLPKT